MEGKVSEWRAKVSEGGPRLASGGGRQGYEGYLHSVGVIYCFIDVQVNITLLYKVLNLGSVASKQCWLVDVVFLSGCRVHGDKVGCGSEWVHSC